MFSNDCSIKQSLENIYKTFLKQRSKPKLFPFQMNKSLCSNDSHTIMSKLLQKGDKNTCLAQRITLGRRKCGGRPLLIQKARIPADNVERGQYHTHSFLKASCRRVLPKGQQRTAHPCRLISKHPACRHPSPPQAAAQRCADRSADSVDAVNAEFLGNPKTPHVQGYVRGHSLDDQGNFISKGNVLRIRVSRLYKSALPEALL